MKRQLTVFAIKSMQIKITRCHQNDNLLPSVPLAVTCGFTAKGLSFQAFKPHQQLSWVSCSVWGLSASIMQEAELYDRRQVYGRIDLVWEYTSSWLSSSGKLYLASDFPQLLLMEAKKQPRFLYSIFTPQLLVHRQLVCFYSDVSQTLVLSLGTW